MSTFTVHVPPGVSSDAARADRTVFVREGFDWASFLLGPLPLLCRGLWRASLAWAAAAAALFLVAVALDLSAAPRLLMYLVLALLTGLEAAEARRGALGRAGFVTAALVSGVTRDAGERLFFGGPLAGLAGTGFAGGGSPGADRPAPARGGAGVIGLFPRPTGAPRGRL